MSTLSKIEIPDGYHVIRFLDNSGDTPVLFRPDVEAEVKEAMDKWEEKMAIGMKTFVLQTTDGGEGYVTRTLDPTTAVETVVSPIYVGG